MRTHLGVKHMQLCLFSWFVKCILQTNLEDGQHHRLLILIRLSCGQKDLSVGIAHCEGFVLTVPGDTLGS